MISRNLNFDLFLEFENPQIVIVEKKIEAPIDENIKALMKKKIPAPL